MTKNQVLIIVDMQTESWPYGEDILDNVLNEIRNAMLDEQHVIVLELRPDDFGDTHDEILGLVRNYYRALRVTKFGDDGSEELIEALTDLGLDHTKTEMRVAGLNRAFCVSATINGLLARGVPKITSDDMITTGQEYGKYWRISDRFVDRVEFDNEPQDRRVA